MAATVTVTRAEVEDFLSAEADLLDAWRLDEWLDLFLADGTYEIPTPDAGDTPPTAAQFFIADDAELLRARVKRLQSRHAHAEQPRSVTHRMIGHARVAVVPGELVLVRAPFIVHRVRDGHVDPYIGWYDHLLGSTEAGLRFRRRRSVLAMDRLRPGSRLSFIL
jgi:p-cumate 2,3-dioxygenase beta subunit